MLSIRRIRTGEAALFRKVRLAALRESPAAFGSTLSDALERSADEWRKQTDTAAEGPDRAMYVALQNNTPVGVARIFRVEGRPGVGELLSVWVAPESRGDGTASALLDALFSWAQENGLQTILASVRKDNARALAFYRKYGFLAAASETPDDPDEEVLAMDIAP